VGGGGRGGGNRRDSDRKRDREALDAVVLQKYSYTSNAW